MTRRMGEKTFDLRVLLLLDLASGSPLVYGERLMLRFEPNYPPILYPSYQVHKRRLFVWRYPLKKIIRCRKLYG